ncbi:hypothetical protein ABN16_01675 [Levilactobacillus koreensis]|uniref:Uncharacterized protein n=1 Tax=Levilactobacillus koreensis TaxID=637971 RepID=A0AAC8UUE7_9LACO|nr:hypothetical protein ABN16_01675 [Levilactobacillus koreensis]
MQPAAEVALHHQPAYSTGDFGDTWSSWLQSEREDWWFPSLKRPHSKRNLWQPQCGNFTLFNGANPYRYWGETGISSFNL